MLEGIRLDDALPFAAAAAHILVKGALWPLPS